MQQKPQITEAARQAALAANNRPTPTLPGQNSSSFNSPRLDANRGKYARTYLEQGNTYEQLRPGYPDSAIDEILATAQNVDGSTAEEDRRSLSILDLGAGTGKITDAFLERGHNVTAVEPSVEMLKQIQAKWGERVAVESSTAEEFEGAPASFDLAVAAQSWHWFDAETVAARLHRSLKRAGSLVLIWNNLEVEKEWVHRYSRIMHAGDVLPENYAPATPTGFKLCHQAKYYFNQQLKPEELIQLAATRSYYTQANQNQRQKIIDNLHWYIYEHLDILPGSLVELPYRSHLFIYRLEQ